MRTYFKNKIFFCFIGLLLCLSSCEKWLDVQPQTRLDRDELFKDEKGYHDALIGVYAGLSSNNLYGQELTFGTMDVLAGYYNPPQIGDVLYNTIYTQFPYKRNDPNRDTRTVAIIDGFWSGLYKQIANLNSILETIDDKKSVFSQDNYRIIKGEALGLRAFIHLDLLRMYGPSYIVDPAALSIPFVDTLSQLISPRLTFQQAADRIISDLLVAEKLMGNDPIVNGQAPNPILASAASSELSSYHNRRYHFNYYAVKATLARAYLWKGDKVNALKYAKEVISNKDTRFPWVSTANLISINSSSAPNKDRTFTTEHIFAINKNNLEENVPLLFSAGGDITLQRILPTSPAVYNRIYNGQEAVGDARYQYWFVTAGNANASYFLSKYYQDVSTSPWYKYQVPLIRISEMYYIAAECEPSSTNGLNWLNTVRNARGLQSIMSAENLPINILAEYQKEFVGEGQLWFYYKRMNFSSLPLNPNFNNQNMYVFDLSDAEIQNGGR